jgi:hypothetical protein
VSQVPATREISDPSRLHPSPRVSVAVLVYNHSAYLAQALDSILAQQVDFPFEVLIGEDCSTDDSFEIALRYQQSHPHAVRILTADGNVGVFRNARRLLDATRGKFIASLDGDDYWLPGKLERQVSFLEAHPDCSAVYANAIAIDRGDRVIGQFNDIGTRSFDLRYMVRRGNFLNSSSILYRAECKQALEANGTNLLDYMVHLTLARCGNIGHLGQPLVVYRVGSPGSMVANDNAKVRELYWQALLSVPSDRVDPVDLAAGMADFLRKIFFRSMRTGNVSLLRGWWPRVVAAAPVGRLRFMALFAWSILRGGARELQGRVAGLIRGGGRAVIYRR